MHHLYMPGLMHRVIAVLSKSLQTFYDTCNDSVLEVNREKNRHGIWKFFWGYFVLNLSFSLGMRVKIILNKLFYWVIFILPYLYSWLPLPSANICIVKLLVSLLRSEHSFLIAYSCCLLRTKDWKAIAESTFHAELMTLFC